MGVRGFGKRDKYEHKRKDNSRKSYIFPISFRELCFSLIPGRSHALPATIPLLSILLRAVLLLVVPLLLILTLIPVLDLVLLSLIITRKTFAGIAQRLQLIMSSSNRAVRILRELRFTAALRGVC